MKHNFEQEVKISTYINPAQLADIFWNMTTDEQARFFQCLYETSVELNRAEPVGINDGKNIYAAANQSIHSFAFQMNSVSHSPHLGNGGRMIMRTIGEHSSREAE